MESHPDRLDFMASYAGGCGNQAKYLGEQERWEESIVPNTWAIETAQKILAIEPRHSDARTSFHGSLIGRAGAYRRLGKLDLARADYQKSLELSEGETHPNFSHFRPRALAFVGNYLHATKAADAIVNSGSATDANFNEMAKVYGDCVAAVAADTTLDEAERRSLAEKYAVRTLELLAQAAEKGRYETTEDIEDLRNDLRLRPVQQREDFKLWLTKLEQSITGDSNKRSVHTIHPVRSVSQSFHRSQAHHSFNRLSTASRPRYTSFHL